MTNTALEAILSFWLIFPNIHIAQNIKIVTECTHRFRLVETDTWHCQGYLAGTNLVKIARRVRSKLCKNVWWRREWGGDHRNFDAFSLCLHKSKMLFIDCRNSKIVKMLSGRAWNKIWIKFLGTFGFPKFCGDILKSLHIHLWRMVLFFFDLT